MYVPAHTCPNDAYSVFGSTLARVFTTAPLRVAERETDAERARPVVTGVGRYVAAIGTRIVVVIIIDIGQTCSTSMCEGCAPRFFFFGRRAFSFCIYHRYSF